MRHRWFPLLGLLALLLLVVGFAAPAAAAPPEHPAAAAQSLLAAGPVQLPALAPALLAFDLPAPAVLVTSDAYFDVVHSQALPHPAPSWVRRSAPRPIHERWRPTPRGVRADERRTSSGFRATE